METPLYEYEYGIIKCRADGWRSDYTQNKSLYSAVNYGYCIYCMCIKLEAEGNGSKEEFLAHSEELLKIYNRTRGVLRFFSKRAKIGYNSLGCYYAESLNMLSNYCDYTDKLEILRKLEVLYKRHKKDVVISYAGVLDSIIGMSNRKNALMYMDKLSKLYENEDSNGLDFYYSSALMKTINCYDGEVLSKHIEKLKELKDKNGDNCKINYYFALSNISYNKGFKEVKKYLDILLDEYRENKDGDAVGIYSFTMRNIICKADIDEAVSLTSILGDVYRDCQLENVAEEYILSLFRLTEELKRPFIDDCINELDKVYSDFPSVENGYIYSRSLFNFLFEVNSNERFPILRKMYDLYEKTKDSRVALEYSKSLFNTSANVKDMDIHKEALGYLKDIYEETKDKNVLREYSMGLLNGVNRGREELLQDIRKLSYEYDFTFLRNLLKIGESYISTKKSLVNIDDVNTICDVKYNEDIKENYIQYSFDGFIPVYVSSIDGGTVNPKDTLTLKAYNISRFVDKNMGLIKKLVFLDRYGYRFLENENNTYENSLQFNEVSFDEAKNWLTPISVSIYLKDNECYSFEVDFEENEKADRDKLFGSGDWVRPKNFSSEGFYL